MPADAFMELQDPSVWGETLDDQFGPDGRNLGAFEIFGFEFGAQTTKQDDDDDPKAKKKPGGATTPSGPAPAVHSQPAVKKFTIKKFIDKASPDLFLACCKAGMPDSKPIAWAIVSIRESGDNIRDSSGKIIPKPYLVIEFQQVWVDSFQWSLTPGSTADSASQEETVTFSFETVLIKYARQERSGAHTPIKIKGFNRSHPEQDVAELPPVAELHG